MKGERPETLQARLPLKEEGPAELSDAELAKFLRGLAALYVPPAAANLALSKALKRVAASLIQSTKTHSTLNARPKLPKKEKALPISLSELRALDAQGIESFVADDQKSKFELIDLAAMRFAIPRAQLIKMRTSEIREKIRSALLHERSISIIEDEARRDGAKRSS